MNKAPFIPSLLQKYELGIYLYVLGLRSRCNEKEVPICVRKNSFYECKLQFTECNLKEC